MNIFYLDKDPSTCAKMHVDKHCVKMILEYAQLLSTAHRFLDGTKSIRLSKTGRKQTAFILPDSRESLLYSATHINHPSAIWCRGNLENYLWLHSLLASLCREYTHRYGKTHKCESIGLVDALQNSPSIIPVGEFTEPTPAMPEHYRVPGDSIQSYKNYYLGDKKRMFAWKNRTQPEWVC